MGLMDMLGGQMGGQMGAVSQMGGNFNSIVNQFGGIQNMMKQFQGFMGKKGVNPQQIALQNLQGKTFSEDTINQFRQFAKQSGMTDEQIDSGLKQAGIIK